MRIDQEKRSRLADVLIVLAVAIGPSTLAATFALFGFNQAIADRAATLYVSNFIFHEIIALLLLVYVLSRQGRDLASVGVCPRFTDVPWSLLLAVGQLACYIVAFTLVTAILPTAPEARPDTLSAMASAPASLLTAIVIINPVFEELIVRGYAATELTALIGNRWVAGGLTVLVQGYYHVYQGTRHALAYAAGFAVFAIYFAVTRRVAPIILAHVYLDAYGVYALASSAHRAA